MDKELILHCQSEAQKWLDSDKYDAETKAEVKALLENEDKTALIDAFYQSLYRPGGADGVGGREPL